VESSVVISRGDDEYLVMYPATGFNDSLSVVGRVMFPDGTTSDMVTFVYASHGIYVGTFPRTRSVNRQGEKWGLVVAEDGVLKFFGPMTEV
jgi:hypothetical protein